MLSKKPYGYLPSRFAGSDQTAAPGTFRPAVSYVIGSCIIIIFLTLAISPAHSQPISGSKITGRVTDASTSEPLHFANVFLANTTKGDATNDAGLYVIPNVPPGKYQLVASMMGYDIQQMMINAEPGGKTVSSPTMDLSVIFSNRCAMAA